MRVGTKRVTLTNFAGMPTNICMEWELYGKGGKLDFFFNGTRRKIMDFHSNHLLHIIIIRQ